MMTVLFTASLSSQDLVYGVLLCYAFLVMCCISSSLVMCRISSYWRCTSVPV